MSNCHRCNSTRIGDMSAKCSDCFSITIESNEHQGYVPCDIGIGSDDYVEMRYCLDCGQIQGKFPLPKSEMEKDVSEYDIREFFVNHFSTGELLQLINSHGWQCYFLRAKEISPKLGEFMREFKDCNSRDPKWRELRMPSVDEFVQMVKDNQPYLRQDW